MNKDKYYPIKILLDENKEPFVPFTTLNAILINGSDKNALEYVDERVEQTAEDARQYVDQSIKDLGTLQRLMGRVDTKEQLPTNPRLGDTWIVGTPDTNSSEWMFVGDKWEELGPFVDLSAYYTSQETAQLLAQLGMNCNTYTDNKVSTVENRINNNLKAYVKTIDGMGPDETGNVSLDLSKYDKVTDYLTNGSEEKGYIAHDESVWSNPENYTTIPDNARYIVIKYASGGKCYAKWTGHYRVDTVFASPTNSSLSNDYITFNPTDHGDPNTAVDASLEFNKDTGYYEAPDWILNHYPYASDYNRVASKTKDGDILFDLDEYLRLQNGRLTREMFHNVGPENTAYYLVSGAILPTEYTFLGNLLSQIGKTENPKLTGLMRLADIPSGIYDTEDFCIYWDGDGDGYPGSTAYIGDLHNLEITHYEYEDPWMGKSWSSEFFYWDSRGYFSSYRESYMEGEYYNDHRSERKYIMLEFLLSSNDGSLIKNTRGTGPSVNLDYGINPCNLERGLYYGRGGITTTGVVEPYYNLKYGTDGYILQPAFQFGIVGRHGYYITQNNTYMMYVDRIDSSTGKPHIAMYNLTKYILDNVTPEPEGDYLR